MGFSEDNRIRHKNYASNCAYELYKELHEKKWSHGDIVVFAEAALKRNQLDKVMHEILKLAVGRAALVFD